MTSSNNDAIVIIFGPFLDLSSFITVPGDVPKVLLEVLYLLVGYFYPTSKVARTANHPSRIGKTSIFSIFRSNLPFLVE